LHHCLHELSLHPHQLLHGYYRRVGRIQGGIPAMASASASTPAPLAAICFPKQMLNLELSHYRSLINDKECKSEKGF
jgi:hypothetical protein